MAEITDLKNIKEFENFTNFNEAVLIYFSHVECNVCKVLKPKVKELIEKQFVKIKMAYSDTVLYPDVAGQNSIFTVPTILVYLDGREYIRKSRNIGIEELSNLIQRPYNMMFGD
jgi:thioredoxin 1